MLQGRLSMGGDYFHLSHISPFSPMNIFIASMNKGSVIGEMRWEIMGGDEFSKMPINRDFVSD